MQFGQRTLNLQSLQIMGVLNLTPDSFFDGGRYFHNEVIDVGAVLTRAEQMVSDGAHILDVGGESTRPGAAPVTEQEECDRVLPVVEALAAHLGIIISVDTSSPVIMLEASKLGAGMINDVRALTRPGALEAAAVAQVPVCLMHMQGQPSTMQQAPAYANALAEVQDYLIQRKQACSEAGISAEKIIVDPGIGFGKNDEHNLELLQNLGAFKQIAPVLLGVSRKSIFGRLLNRPVEQRLAGSLAVALRALEQGVSILRVHDVAETADVIKMWQMTGKMQM